MVSSCGLKKKKSHYNSRVSLHEAPTKMNISLFVCCAVGDSDGRRRRRATRRSLRGRLGDRLDGLVPGAGLGGRPQGGEGDCEEAPGPGDDHAKGQDRGVHVQRPRHRQTCQHRAAETAGIHQPRGQTEGRQ